MFAPISASRSSVDPWLRGALALVLSLLLAADVSAGEPKKKPAPSSDNAAAPDAPSTAAAAYLRLWKGDFASRRTVHIVLHPAGRKAAPIDFVAAAEGYRFTEYAVVPTGLCTIEVINAKAPTAKLTSLPAQFAAGSFTTVLLTEAAGSLAAQLLNDTPAPGESAGLVVRNFIPNLGSLQIDAGPDLHIRLSSPESFLHLGGLPRAKMKVDASGTEGEGKAFQWSDEIDFTNVRHATVLIYPDPYGRIRPRVIVDGQGGAATKEESPAKPEL